MKRAAKVTTVRDGDLGSRKKHVSGHVIDKSKRINHLQTNVGKKSSPQTANTEVESIPSICSNVVQVSTATRHMVRSEGAVHLLTLSQLASTARAQDTGTSSETIPVKNEFRIAFSTLPEPGPEYGNRRLWQFEALNYLTRALFLEARMLDLTSLAGVIAPSASSLDSYFVQNYLRLVADGRVLTSQDGFGGKRETPYAFDLRRDRPFSAHGSLRTILQQYLASAASNSAKRAALAATRVLLSLNAHAATAAVMKAAANVPFQALHGLPERFMVEATSAAKLQKKTIANFTSALRALLAFGLRNDLFPLFFPPRRPLDAWTDIVEEAFPLSAAGRTTSDALKARRGLFGVFSEARDALLVGQPSDLTPAHVVEVIRRLSAAHRMADHQKVAGLKTVMGRPVGQWDHPVVRVVVAGINAMRPKPAVPYLDNLGTPVSSICTSDGFRTVLASHAMHEEWVLFFDWYFEYCSLSWRELDARKSEFPPRPPIRELTLDVFLHRLTTARAYLGAARELFPDEYRGLTPADVFGTHFRELTQFLLSSWAAAALGPNPVSHQSSAGLVHLVVSGGMIARALFDLEVHRRSPPSQVQPADVNPSSQAFVDRERINPNRTQKENALVEAYNYSRSVSLNLQEEQRNAESGSGSNTVKDLRRAIRETPFWKFQQAQHELLSRVQKDIDEGNALGREALSRCVATLTHGILLSGGVRRSEICHLREGQQTNLLAGSMHVELRAVDRKNAKPHTFDLRDRWLPDWFLRHYLDIVRPAITSPTLAPGIPTSFLLFSPSSHKPYGFADERADGSGRDSVKLRYTKKMLADRWRKHVALAFVSLGFCVPIGSHRFTMHIVRNVGGHAVFVTKGLEAAAHFLGDSVGTVEGVYGALIGESVDTSLLE